MSTARKASLVLLTACGLILVQYWPRPEEPRPRRPKTVLYWTGMFDRDDFYLGLGRDAFRACPQGDCRATADRSELAADEFDAVVFHGPEFGRKYRGVPSARSARQVYVYGNQESPVNSPTNGAIAEIGGFFNWTMTYRYDSDVFRPYGRVYKQKTNYTLPTVEKIRKRSGKIAWQVSNCHTSSQREDLYAKLRQKIRIDVYGRCGKLYCPRNESESCWKKIETKYKFYLSFENSFCEDYVTEKLYNALKYDVVPIVYGGADYDVVAPPHSVIDVKKFETVDSLVKFIEDLDRHPEKYLEYFRWKHDYVIDTSPQPVLCELCKKLHSVEESDVKVYGDISEWWTGPVRNYKCKTGNELPNIIPRVISA